ncbi:MAG: aspartate kinase [Flavobacteriales bacterium]|nr:aspartate kinase [Flavobacteriales bacterium]
MKVFKFGGASVKDPEAVKNVAEILKNYAGEKICVVVSAMGKTTNALERITKCYFDNDKNITKEFDDLKAFHKEILSELFPNSNHSIYDEINNLFVEVEWAIEDPATGTYDFEYDQFVSIGELVSTKIISAYLNDNDVKSKWFDVRDIIKTDNTYREGKVDWEETVQNMNNTVGKHFESSNGIAITQGFIGCTSENFTTTLGREGSDYSAAILAYALGATEMTIWKDVPGMLNADPKWFNDTKKLDHISYREAIELAYYGATVIHPKTIKPLQNKAIPLYVKSFLEYKKEGTIIDEETAEDSLIPSFIFKMEQLLISLSPKDFSFIVEGNMQDIFGLFARHNVTMNLMQNSALNLSVTIDNDEQKVPGLLEELKKDYKVWLNNNLELVTIRHYNSKTIDRVTRGKEILVEQKSRHTARFVMKDLGWVEA